MSYFHCARSLLLATALLAPIALPLAAPAMAQGSVVAVNGEPITDRDINQRMRINQLLYRKPTSRPAALEELINDRVKLAEGRRQGMRATNAGMDEIMSRFASQNRQTLPVFEQNLSKAGIEPEALRGKIAADTIWTELLRNRSRNRNVSNSDLNAEVDRRAAKGEAMVTDYVVRQVVFVVPQGSSPGQRERDANAVRGRFTDCDSGVELMRTLRDVAVKERIGRSSGDLSKPLNDTLSKTPLGRLTAPYRSEQGIEMLAVCEKNQREDRGALRTRVEQELQEKTATTGSDTYLKELRSKVVITR
jgi:peptidyl-prolyl cis-trans isomerase SurA